MSMFDYIRDFHSLTGQGNIQNIRLHPQTTLRINPNFIHYLTDSFIVFVSGNNLVIYDFETKEQKFLMRKNNQRKITYLNVGIGLKNLNPTVENVDKKILDKSYKKRKSAIELEQIKISLMKDILICLGEYSEKEERFYLTVIKPYNPNVQYTFRSSERFWKINYTTVLNNTGYCVAISQKEVNSKKNPIISRISFGKYTQENFVSEETIPENLNYICYNPKNTIELIVCGKGYLRLWNIFINEGSLKEHQQRFLRGKQEKEHTFIKAQFFDKKPFLLIVGTMENMFYIIDSFVIIHEINVCYSYENIYDLYATNNQFVYDEDENIESLKELMENINKEDFDTKLKAISLQSSNDEINNINNKKHNELPSDNELSYRTLNNNNNEENNTNNNNNTSNISDKEDVFHRLYQSQKEDNTDAKIEKSNKVKFFELIKDDLLFIIYQNDGMCMMYKIDWNRKIQDDESETDFKKWNASDCRVIRISKDIKTSILDFSMYKPTRDLIMMVEQINNNKSENNNNNKNKKTTEISLFKMKIKIFNEKNISNPYSIGFENKIEKDKENKNSNILFSGYFENTKIKFLDFNEKKQNIYIVSSDNNFRVYDILKNEYIINQKFDKEIFSLTQNPTNNLIAFSTRNNVSIYAKFKHHLQLFCELEISDSIITWSSKGNFLVIGGENRVNSGNKKNYCIYFVDAFTYETTNVIENIAHKIIQLKLIENDKYLFAMLENCFIIGFFLNFGENCSNNLHELYNDQSFLLNNNGSIAQNHIKLIYTHNPKDKKYSSFDYDSELGLVIAIQSDNKKLSIMNSMLNNNNNPNGKNKNIYIEYNCNLTTIKIVKELKILIAGDLDGSIKIFHWPFKNLLDNNRTEINEYLLNEISLHETNIKFLLNAKNFSSFITMSNDSVIIISNLQIEKYNEYKFFEYFTKGSLPQVEVLLQPYEMYEMQRIDINNKEKNVEILEKFINKLKILMNEDIDEIKDIHKTELENMENNLKQNTEDEQSKFDTIALEIKTLKENMANALQKRLNELDKDKTTLSNKYKEKIELYDTEINRLKNELLNIKNSIEEKYESEIVNQKTFYDTLIKEYNEKFLHLKNSTNESLTTLVNLSSEYDEAVDKIVTDYKKLIEKLDEKIIQTKEINNNILKEKEEKLKQAKKLEDEHKEKLEQKVKDSDKLIEKNVEIKQSIINATQRTITFQEQLLETEKNLIKIDKKLEDLMIKNKHLEQIRFVLEHRMTSLEKEKAPLEGQCNFLENQKNKLTEEFNKIILQINKHNQELENKQSQLRASLIQNYEIHDQKNYVEEKLIQLKNDIEQFLMNYQDSDENKSSLSENKATKVALNFKKFYDKYFSTTIEEELANYQFYSQKLQEQSDKDGIANNFDLVMRNKAEEKLICEKEKVEELKTIKEKGFKRIQNENTILIAECNRLRKNLHEIYMHVVDIEQRFEMLTKINPKLSKSEIVAQIKEFIRVTHEKIKENYSKSRKAANKRNSNLKNYSIINSNNNISNRINDINNLEESKGEFNNNSNDYEGLIKLPEIKNKSISFLSQNKQDIFDGENSGNISNSGLPMLNQS